ncbi:MAG: DUF6064 family protein [Gemmatimonadota bacterium]|nr:DUF6064 family protein [Gemmatimonadota bacterium]
MSEWWTYRLSDFLMFEPRTYYRLFERINGGLWPAPLLALALGVALLVLAGRGRAPRATLILLVPAWLAVAVAFHWQRYAPINFLAPWYAWASGLEGALLLAAASGRVRWLFPGAGLPPDRVGVGLLTFAVLLQPLIGPLLDRSWQGVELFGLAPDPTALATLGVVLALRARWALLVIPVLLALASGATLWAMEAPDAWVTPVVAVLGVVRCSGKRRLGD